MIKSLITNLDEKYYETRFELIQQFIIDNLEYWQQIPLLTYVERGKAGYGSYYDLFTKKIYSVSHNNYMKFRINCNTGELLFDKRYMDDIKDLDIESVDGKKLYDYYMIELKRMDHWDDGSYIEPEDFILDAINYGFDITYELYNLHYLNSKLFSKTEEEFNIFKKEIIKQQAKKELLK